MACMHEKTFEIYHNDQCIVSDGYIEIDELIAPSIQILNRKDYITEWCCSGHPFDKELLRNNSEIGYREIYVQCPNSYISFREGVFLPTLPPGFINESHQIMKLLIRRWYHHVDNNFFEMSRNILEAMEQLYKWALDLPKNTG